MPNSPKITKKMKLSRFLLTTFGSCFIDNLDLGPNPAFTGARRSWIPPAPLGFGSEHTVPGMSGMIFHQHSPTSEFSKRKMLGNFGGWFQGQKTNDKCDTATVHPDVSSPKRRWFLVQLRNSSCIQLETENMFFWWNSSRVFKVNTVHVEQLAVLALDVVLWCMSVYRRATPVEPAQYRWWLFRYKKTKHGIIYTKSVISETCEFECIFYYHHNSSSPNLPSLRPIDIADWMPERDTWNHGRIHHFQVSAPRFLDTLKVYKISGSFLWRDAVFAIL